MKQIIIGEFDIIGLRKSIGMSQTALAAHLGISRGYLSQIERGHKNPKIKLVEDICGILGAELCIIKKP